MRIELDFPPSELFPNRSKGKHWGVTHAAKVKYREDSVWLTRQQMGGWKHKGGDLELVTSFHMPDKRQRDADNCLAAAKAGLDGMAEALGVNDKFFQPITIYRYHGEKPGKLIVEIKEQP